MGVIDRLPKLDGGALIAIERNAQRWITTGTEQQKAEAEGVLAAIAAERQRRLAEGASAGRDDTVGHQGFSSVWMSIVQRLRAGDTIRNWGHSSGYTGGTFQIEDVGNSAITITGGSTSQSRRISKGDFENVFAVWAAYSAGSYPRAKMTSLSQNTTYILSILQRVTRG